MNNFAFSPLLHATLETLYMVFVSSFLSIVLGMLLGIVLFLSREKQAFENRGLHYTLSFIVNATRSVPYIILMISILPLTRMIAGTTIGINAAIVPLTLAAIPFYARICENALSEVPQGLIETAHAFGANTYQLVFKVLIPQSLPALIRGMTLTIIGLIGYSAMAGAVGGGGLGELAINYGYQRFDALVTLETVIVLIVIVQLVQFSGDYLAKHRAIKPLIFASIVLSLCCVTYQTLLNSADFTKNEVVRVGVMTGWPQEVMKVAQTVALKEYHLEIKVIAFDDYVIPNTALAKGDIDANIFQHVPYLDAQIKARHFDLTPIAKTFVYPMGFFSRKIHSLADLPIGAIVAVPNDPSNEARTLLLLQKAGLIKLKPNSGILATINDVIANPKSLKFKPLDAAQVPRVLQDADLVALTNDYVGPAGFTIDDALLKEDKDSLYANIIVVRTQDRNNPLFKDLASVMHSKPVLDATQKIFPHGAAIQAW